MLSVIEYGKDEYDFPALIVLGCFDALHTGHRELLKKAKLQAKINGLDLGVMMFRDGKGDKLVYSFEERIAILEQFNVKFVLAIDFNDAFKKTAPLDFLEAVEDKINVKAYMSGKDFRFGEKAKGKSSTLKNYAEDDENGVWYMPVKDIEMDGEKISTTLIKNCLAEGNVVKANKLLGSEFALTGEVVKGAGRGSSVVGFPTVNIIYPDWKHPLKHGVYNVKCMIGDTDYQGVANFGTCPTFGDDRVALEVYIEGFSGDLYGQVLTVRFIDFVRDIEAFASVDELSGQIQSDVQAVSEEVVVADAAVEEPWEAVEEEKPVEKVEAVEEVFVEYAESIVGEQIFEEVSEPVETVVEKSAEPVETVEEESVSAEAVVEIVDEFVTEPVEVAEEKSEIEETADESGHVDVLEEVADAYVEIADNISEVADDNEVNAEEQPVGGKTVSEVIEEKIAEICKEECDTSEDQIDESAENLEEQSENQSDEQSEIQTEENNVEEISDGGEDNLD